MLQMRPISNLTVLAEDTFAIFTLFALKLSTKSPLIGCAKMMTFKKSNRIYSTATAMKFGIALFAFYTLK